MNKLLFIMLAAVMSIQTPLPASNIKNKSNKKKINKKGLKKKKINNKNSINTKYPKINQASAPVVTAPIVTAPVVTVNSNIQEKTAIEKLSNTINNLDKDFNDAIKTKTIIETNNAKKYKEYINQVKEITNEIIGKNTNLINITDKYNDIEQSIKEYKTIHTKIEALKKEDETEITKLIEKKPVNTIKDNMSLIKTYKYLIEKYKTLNQAIALYIKTEKKIENEEIRYNKAQIQEKTAQRESLAERLAKEAKEEKPDVTAAGKMKPLSKESLDKFDKYKSSDIQDGTKIEGEKNSYTTKKTLEEWQAKKIIQNLDEHSNFNVWTIIQKKKCLEEIKNMIYHNREKDIENIQNIIKNNDSLKKKKINTLPQLYILLELETITTPQGKPIIIKSIQNIETQEEKNIVTKKIHDLMKNTTYTNTLYLDTLRQLYNTITNYNIDEKERHKGSQKIYQIISNIFESDIIKYTTENKNVSTINNNKQGIIMRNLNKDSIIIKDSQDENEERNIE